MHYCYDPPDIERDETGALERLGRVSYMTPATTTPDPKVSVAIVAMAKGMLNASAKSPAAIAPMA